MKTRYLLKVFQEWEKRIKENARQGEFNILYIARTFVDATCTPTQHNDNKKPKNKTKLQVQCIHQKFLLTNNRIP
jgi:hypothetical protein